MIDILKYLPGKCKRTPSGWYSVNAVCCHHNGERQDRRGRGGILIEPDGSWRYNCFNCGYVAGYTLGEPLTRKARTLLGWLGVDPTEVEQLNLLSLRHRTLHGRSNFQPKVESVKFHSAELPKDSELLDWNNPLHETYRNYILQRGVDPQVTDFYVSPNAKGRNQHRIIVPFTYKGQTVGHTSRYIDGQGPKWNSNVQPGYVFGVDFQRPEWDTVLVVEGVFDALCLNGLAVLHNDTNEQQANLISSLGKRVVVVPDRDRAGIRLINRALTMGWSVSFPEWETDIKDAADAVVRYGRLVTLISILESVESNRLKIELKLKQHVKRF